MKYKAYLNQGGGCDYTIGCGQTIIDIEANSMSEAETKLCEIIKKEYFHDERALDTAEIYEIVNVMAVDIKEIYIEIEKEKDAMILKLTEERDKKEFERLKSKFNS